MRRLHLDREFYTKNSQPVPPEQFSADKALCFITELHCGRINVLFFLGKQAKPHKQYSYTNLESARKAISAYYANLIEVFKHKEKERETQKKKRAEDKRDFEGVSGSIFVASWGYEQTNVDAYQMIRRINSQEIEAVKIGLISVFDGTGNSMSRDVKPNPVTPEKAETLPKIIMRIVSKTSVKKVKAHNFMIADLWDGKCKYYESWYA